MTSARNESAILNTTGTTVFFTNRGIEILRCARNDCLFKAIGVPFRSLSRWETLFLRQSRCRTVVMTGANKVRLFLLSLQYHPLYAVHSGLCVCRPREYSFRQSVAMGNEGQITLEGQPVRIKQETRYPGKAGSLTLDTLLLLRLLWLCAYSRLGTTATSSRHPIYLSKQIHQVIPSD